MVRECFKANTGIMFNSSALKEIGMDPLTLYPFVKPRPAPLPLSPTDRIRNLPAKEIPIRAHNYLRKRKEKVPPETEADMHSLIKEAMKGTKSKTTQFLGSEEQEDLHDVLSPKYDQLKVKKGWWVLELLPLHLRYQRGDNQWVSYFEWVFSGFLVFFFFPVHFSLTNLCMFHFTDNLTFIGQTWLALGSSQNSPRMDLKFTGLSSYVWRPSSRMKCNATKAKNMFQNLISRSSRHGLTNQLQLAPRFLPLHCYRCYS